MADRAEPEQAEDASEENSRRVLEASDRYGKMLLALASGMMGSREAASDVVQTVIARCLQRGLPDGDPKAWLLTVVANECRTQLRRRTLETRYLRTRRTQSRTETATNLEHPLQERLERTLANLPDTDQSLLRRRVIDGASYSELSDELGVSVSTLTTRVSRLLARLRSTLQPDEPTD